MATEPDADVYEMLADELESGEWARSSAAVADQEGWRKVGAISASGTRTKLRCSMRGWGTCRSAVSMVALIVEKDVEVDEARTFGEGFLAAHLRFDVAEGGEELCGGVDSVCASRTALRNQGWSR